MLTYNHALQREMMGLGEKGKGKWEGRGGGKEEAKERMEEADSADVFCGTATRQSQIDLRRRLHAPRCLPGDGTE